MMVLLPSGHSSIICSVKRKNTSFLPAANTQGKASCRPAILCFLSLTFRFVFSVTFRRLVTALAACALPEAWAGSGDGLFLVASASHDENDSEEGNNSRGVIKLRLLSANQLDKHAVANAKNRATSVICSLVCHRRHSGLAKSLSLSMCEGPDYDDGSKRGIYVTASIYGGFCAWCITAADFLSMSKGTAKTITSFKC